MRKLVVKDWHELSPLWPGIMEGNAYDTPYQSYEFLTQTGKGKPQRKDLLRLIGVKELNLVLYKDDEPIAIAPLLIKKKNRKPIVYFRGHFTTASTLDFVYKPGWSYDDFKFLMDGVKELMGDVSFSFYRVNEKSVTYRYLKEYLAPCQIEQHECVFIPVPPSYDEWFRGLKKSCRRNITRHINRLERENMKWRVDFYRGEAIDARTYKNMMAVYAHRFLVKNNFRLRPLTKPVMKILTTILLRDKVTLFLNSCKESFHGVLYLNDRIAAFTSGLVCRDGKIAFCRLAMNTGFAGYGPGVVLISSTMRHIIEQNQKGCLNVTELDLSEGTAGGMSYKYAFGGVGYFQYDFIK